MKNLHWHHDFKLSYSENLKNLEIFLVFPNEEDELLRLEWLMTTEPKVLSAQSKECLEQMFVASSLRGQSITQIYQNAHKISMASSYVLQSMIDMYVGTKYWQNIEGDPYITIEEFSFNKACFMARIIYDGSKSHFERSWAKKQNVSLLQASLNSAYRNIDLKSGNRDNIYIDTLLYAHHYFQIMQLFQKSQAGKTISLERFITPAVDDLVKITNEVGIKPSEFEFRRDNLFYDSFNESILLYHHRL